ncbi:MAG: S-layer protein, partial [Candidatus Diapherotrites archaeon]|nr:S-layer protein [Candidatus Diapherotrites archaeon]
MKGFNIKRIAAIGLGAALVGSVLAPAAFAGIYNNFATAPLKKTDIVDATTGAPVVDIVVGSMGQASDVVWAGNIAAKVAQMAVVPVSGSTGEKTADITVGGTQSTTGSGNTDENTVSFTSGWSEFNPIKADYSDSKSFVSISGRTIKNAGVESQINIDEN